MENRIDVADQNTQQIGKNPTDKIPSNTEKQRFNYRKILKIVLLLLLFGIFGAYLLNLQTKRRQFANQNFSRTVPPAVENLQTDSTTVNNFKRFVNAKYGYYFDYPRSWEINKQVSNLSDKEFGQKQIIEEQVRSITINDPLSPETWFTIDTNELNQTGNLKGCFDLNDCISKITTSFPVNIVKTEENFLGNRAAKITFNQTTQSNTQPVSHLFVILNDDVYHFTMSSMVEVFEEYKKIFDQILSSFKLIHQSRTLDLVNEPILLTIKSPHSSNITIKFKFSFKIKPNDVVKLASSSFEVIRKNARVKIGPAFDGGGITYDKIPEIYDFTNSKISPKPIYRIKSQDQSNIYFYVNYYAEGAKGCSQHSPLPAACSMGGIEGLNTPLNVSCQADSVGVNECDDIVKTLEKTETDL